MNRHRIEIIEALQRIASKGIQIDEHDHSDKDFNVADRLLKSWENVYRPELEGFNGDFSEQELKQLGCFTDFFLARTNGLPAQFRELLKDPAWNTICEFAAELLKDFEKVSDLLAHLRAR